MAHSGPPLERSTCQVRLHQSTCSTSARPRPTRAPKICSIDAAEWRPFSLPVIAAGQVQARRDALTEAVEWARPVAAEDLSAAEPSKAAPIRSADRELPKILAPVARPFSLASPMVVAVDLVGLSAAGHHAVIDEARSP